MFGNDPSVVNDALLGSRQITEQLSLNQFTLLANTSANSSAFVSPISNSAIGILGTIPTRYWLNYSLAGGFSLNGFQQVPIFSKSSGNPDDLDTQITDSITVALQKIALIDKSILTTPNRPAGETAAFLLTLEKYLAPLPYGGVFFSNIKHAQKIYEWIFNIGSDKRLVSSTNFPPPGIRQLYLQTALDNGIFRNGNVSSFGDATITQGYRAMPQLRSTKIEIAFDGLIGGILYPLGISFLLPIFVVTLVKEKEDRIAVMMKMNGLKTVVYYLSHFGTVIKLMNSYVFHLVINFFCSFYYFRLSFGAVYVHCYSVISHNCSIFSMGNSSNLISILLRIIVQQIKICQYCCDFIGIVLCHYIFGN